VKNATNFLAKINLLQVFQQLKADIEYQKVEETA